MWIALSVVCPVGVDAVLILTVIVAHLPRLGLLPIGPLRVKVAVGKASGTVSLEVSEQGWQQPCSQDPASSWPQKHSLCVSLGAGLLYIDLTHVLGEFCVLIGQLRLSCSPHADQMDREGMRVG